MTAIPFPFDMLWRPIRYVEGELECQALLTVYPSHPGFVDVAPKAIALASGESFPGVNAGASGLGYTVLTRGLICFGEPRDGLECFMAAPDYRQLPDANKFIAIKRGRIKVDEDGHESLAWQDAGGGIGLVALTFAGEAFHAVYFEGLSGPTRIETSFDGLTWNKQNSVFPISDSMFAYTGTVGGAVAFNNEGDSESGNYAAAGSTEVEASDGAYTAQNLAWATAGAPPRPVDAPPGKILTWNYKSIAEPEGNPGARTREVGLTWNQQGTIAGGRGIFIAATYKKEVTSIDFGGSPETVLLLTASAALSPDGVRWTDHEALPGVQEGFWTPSVESLHDQRGESQTTAVLFVRNDSADDSYFVCTTRNYYVDQAVNLSGTTWGTVHQSYDGKVWQLIHTEGSKGDLGQKFCTGLSVIAADLSSTTIVHL